MAGSGIGTFIFAPLTNFLMVTYCWQGALIILSGVMLNIIVCGSFFRPLNTRRRRRASVPDDEAALSFKDPDVESRHRFILRCRPANEEDCKNTGGSLTDSPMVQTSSLRQLIYFEPVTRSVIQFPTYLCCEWDELAPELLQELNKDNNEESKSLVEVRMACVLFAAVDIFLPFQNWFMPWRFVAFDARKSLTEQTEASTVNLYKPAT